MKEAQKIRNQIRNLQKQLRKQYKPIKADFGKKIQKRRKEMGLSALELAQLIGRDRTQITNIELGNSGTTVKTLVDICDALQTTPNDLLGYEKS